MTFENRLCHKSIEVDFNEQDLKKLVEKCSWMEDDASMGLSKIGTLSLSEVSQKKRQAANIGKPHIKTRPSLLELLKHLRSAIIREKVEFVIDYLRVDWMCWELLRSVRIEGDAILESIYGPQYLKKGSQLPYVVGCIFLAATDSKRLGQVIAKKSNIVTSEAIEKAASSMDSFMESGGGSLVIRMMKHHYDVDIAFEEDCRGAET